MEDVNIVLITGMSGAGKTTAMSVLEDMGYHCIDQFPVELIHELGKLLRRESDVRYHNVALATNALDYTKFLMYLAECLESVLNQTYQNYELILINDGSTDNSGKICDEYSQKHDFIKVFHPELLPDYTPHYYRLLK